MLLKHEGTWQTIMQVLIELELFQITFLVHCMSVRSVAVSNVDAGLVTDRACLQAIGGLIR